MLSRIAVSLFGDWVHLPLALHHAENDCLVRRATTTDAMSASANVSLVNFNVTKQRPFIVYGGHVFADKIGHAPRRLIGHAKLPLQFFRGNAMAGSSEQVNRVEPKLQRRPAVFKRRADCRVNVMSAPLAGIGALGFNPIPLGFSIAGRADMALTKAGVKQVLQTGFGGRELGKKFLNRCAGFFFLLFHAPNIRQRLPYVKGIIPFNFIRTFLALPNDEYDFGNGARPIGSVVLYRTVRKNGRLGFPASGQRTLAFLSPVWQGSDRRLCGALSPACDGKHVFDSLLITGTSGKVLEPPPPIRDVNRNGGTARANGSGGRPNWSRPASPEP